ncbi:Pogo transposable element [Phytophthora megakarya]|uniref:Pogo transposable element n=1 Tax=Phytophthora megakarya TaxID=4795 RepID=A0A225W328_9STRA|nr:Pogo transposable element [Phytophthora megakarya]
MSRTTLNISAHISKAVSAKCSKRNMGLRVVPGGFTASLQAGDIGIYKQFKDILSWKEIDQSVVDSSITSSGFSSIPDEWFTWRHDVYGRKFQQRWNDDEEEQKEYNDEDFKVDAELTLWMT